MNRVDPNFFFKKFHIVQKLSRRQKNRDGGTHERANERKSLQAAKINDFRGKTKSKRPNVTSIWVVVIIHAVFKSTPCSSPRHVQVHALFKPTPCSSPCLVQVHALFKSTPCSSPRLFSVMLILRPRKTELNSNKHACSPSAPCSPSRLIYV